MTLDHDSTMAVEDDDEGKVPGPTIRPAVVAKFILASAMMVVAPAALFFLSMHGYFDSVFLPVSTPNDRYPRGMLASHTMQIWC